MKKTGLFLDDERVPSDVTWLEYPKNIEWTVVRDAVEFHYQILELTPDVISFDHDIQCFCGKEEVTGYTLLKDVVDIYLGSGMELPECFFHTQNPIGKENMLCYYNNAVKFQKGE